MLIYINYIIIKSLRKKRQLSSYSTLHNSFPGTYSDVLITSISSLIVAPSVHTLFVMNVDGVSHVSSGQLSA